MADTPQYHSFPLFDSQDGVGYGYGKKMVEGLLYIPRLKYVQMDEKSLNSVCQVGHLTESAGRNQWLTVLEDSPVLSETASWLITSMKN